VTAPNTTASSPAADLDDEDCELEEFEVKAGRRSARRVRVLGGLAAGAAFLGTLILSPSYQDAGAWGLAIVAAAAVVVICHVGVRLAARPGVPEPGRLTGDYVAISATAVTFAVIGYPAAKALGLFSDGF
jgi:hypothetical protein